MKNLMTLMIMACLLSTAACNTNKREKKAQNPAAAPAAGKPDAPKKDDPSKKDSAENKPADVPAPAVPPRDSKTPGSKNPTTAKTLPALPKPAAPSDDGDNTDSEDNVASKPTVSNSEGSWTFPEVRVLMADTLLATKKNNINVISENALQTEESAKFKIYDRGAGMLCTTEAPGDLKKGDTFTFVKTEKKPWAEDQHGSIMEIQFKDEKSKRDLKFECIIRGEQKAEDFVKNMKDILQFKNDKGQFSQEGPKKDAADYAKQENKFRSFRIVKLDIFEQINAHKEGDKTKALIPGGKLVDSEEAQNMVALDKAAEACQISKVTGTLNKDLIYKWTDTRNLGADRTRGIGMLDYTYTADKDNAVNIICVLRLNAPYDILLETLAGVVEFGVAK